MTDIQNPNPLLEALYGDIGMSDEEYDALVDEPLSTLTSDILFEMLPEHVPDDSTILDIGCRDARHCVKLAEMYHTHVVGIDPVARHIELAQTRIAQHQELSIRALLGQIEHLPAEDASVSLIWCRDVLSHVQGLAQGLRECARVLQPGGVMMVYQTFATDLLEEKERRFLCNALAVVPENMNPSNLESHARRVGLSMTRCVRIGSQWREAWEADGSGVTSSQLLRIARMRRRENELIKKLTKPVYDAEIGDCLWGIYQMIGKLEPRAYLFTKQ